VLQHYVIGVGAILMLMVAWIGVQTAWRRVFPATDGDPDVLAGRMGCHGCEDSDHCDRKHENGMCSVEEEIR